jgi:5-(carboxyamino)imidazole ribonucleotide synthase
MSPPEPLAPGATIGILGGGQLGRMLAMAAARLGMRCHVFCPDADSPAFDVAAVRMVADYDDPAALDAFGRAVDVVTYEFENVPVAAVERLERIVPVRPGARALAVGQDRLTEKQFLTGHGISVSDFAAAASAAELREAVERIGLPAIVKTRRYGYDGKGQARIARPEDVDAAFAALAGEPALVEAFVPFSREISVIAVRGADGATASYDPAENDHSGGILRASRVPARVRPETAARAAEIARAILADLHYVGVIGVELFVVEEAGQERLLVNEFAPRVHNSGHWTEDGCAVSQFESHIRAVAGWPLAPTERHADVEMINLIGDDVKAWRQHAADPAARLHLYGKREARPGRKMGHVNRLRQLGSSEG